MLDVYSKTCKATICKMRGTCICLIYVVFVVLNIFKNATLEKCLYPPLLLLSLNLVAVWQHGVDTSA